MVNFFVTLFFSAAMLCLLALPVAATCIFVKGRDWQSRKNYVITFAALLAAFLTFLILSGRIYDASLTPEQRDALEQKTSQSETVDTETPESTISQ